MSGRILGWLGCLVARAGVGQCVSLVGWWLFGGWVAGKMNGDLVGWRMHLLGCGWMKCWDIWLVAGRPAGWWSWLGEWAQLVAKFLGWRLI